MTLKSILTQERINWVLRYFFVLVVLVSVLAFGAIGAVFWYFSTDLPPLITLADYKPAVVSRVYSSAIPPQLLGEFYGKERRYLLPPEKMPKKLIEAFISSEDDKFFQHQGVNLAAIIRASIANLRAGHVVQGGSTITQQVAKSLLLSSEKSMSRKIREVILASRLEKNLNKEQILYLYLNQIYLGSGAYGVQAAGRVYFNKDATDLTLAESAILAGLPQAPGNYSPFINPKRAKERQIYVLKRMMENKFITEDEFAQESKRPLKLFFDTDINKHLAPDYVEHIRRYLLEKYGEKRVYEDGLSVVVPTTIELSKKAQEAVREGLRTLDRRLGYRGAIKKRTQQFEVEKFLVDSRMELVKRKLGYTVFTPDGKLNQLMGLELDGIKQDEDLLVPGEEYRVVVTSFDKLKQNAGVMIGLIKGEIPLAEAAWADPGIKDISKTLSKGDEVLARFTGRKDQKPLFALVQEPEVQGALLSMDANTGHVIAMVGGYNYSKSELNRAVQSERQPGSAFKPIIYAAAVERGFTPGSIIFDSPIVFDDQETGKWKPENFSARFSGDTTFRNALVRSMNVPTIKIVQSIELPNLLGFVDRIGFRAKLPRDFSISLGSCSVTLLEMTRIYTLFPRLGRTQVPIFFTKIYARDGTVLEETKPVPSSPVVIPPAPSPLPQVVVSPPGTGGVVPLNLPTYPRPEDPTQVLDPRVAYVMTHLMTDVVNFGTGHGAKDLGRSAAGKTGTTNDFLDAWFMGYTPELVTGAWVGFDSPKSIGSGETGAKVALPIWLSFMREAVKRYPDREFEVPPGIVFASIDAATGKLASPNSIRAIREAFIEGTQPKEETPAERAAPAAGNFLKEDLE